MGRTVVSRPVLAKSSKDLILNQYKLGMVVCDCHPSYWESINRRIVMQTCMGININLFKKYLKERAGGMAQVVEHL
jgi:hypothetical protein